MKRYPHTFVDYSKERFTYSGSLVGAMDSDERREDQGWTHHFLERGYRTAQVKGAPVLYAPEFSFYYYALNNYKNALALDSMFGYRGWETDSLIPEVVVTRGEPSKLLDLVRRETSCPQGRCSPDGAIVNRIESANA